MKIYPSALDVVASLLVVGLSSTTAFVANSYLASNTCIHNQLRTICFAKSVDVSESSTSSDSSSFPYDDGAIRYAYDEWRLIYGKGDFDSDRFEHFKTNHRTLTTANMKVRENAVQSGQPTSQWMSLNEYGDYSLDDYEAMLQGQQQNNDMNYSFNNNHEGQQDQYGRPIRSTQVLQQQLQQGRSTQVIKSDQQQQKFVSYNNGQQVGEYQDQFGRTIRSTRIQQDPMQQAASQVFDDGSYPQGTRPIKSNGNIPNNYAGGTQVVQSINQRAGSDTGSGTQVIGSTDSAQNSNRNLNSNEASFGTQVVRSGNESVSSMSISSSLSSGTQVIKYSNSTNELSSISSSPTYGTQVVQKSNSLPRSSTDSRSGTQVIESMDQGSTLLSGTRVIQPTNNLHESLTTEGTQNISNKDDTVQSVESTRETLVVSKDDKETWTNLLNKELLFGGVDSESGNSIDDSDDNDNVTPTVGSRGTIVIKRQFPEPKNIFNFFDTNSDEENQIEKGTEGKDSTPRSNNLLRNFINSTNSKDKEKATLSVKAQQLTSTKTATLDDGNQIEKGANGEDSTPPSNNFLKNFINPTSSKKKDKSTLSMKTQQLTSTETALDEGIQIEKGAVEDSTPPSNNFLKNFINPTSSKKKDKSTLVVEPQQQTSTVTDDSGTRTNSDGIFSLFGGKINSLNSRSVRTTISLQQNNNNAEKVVPNVPINKKRPSILSFFGDAKKVDKTSKDSNARSTLIVNKPSQQTRGGENQIWSPFFSNKKTKETSANVSKELSSAVLKVCHLFD